MAICVSSSSGYPEAMSSSPNPIRATSSLSLLLLKSITDNFSNASSAEVRYCVLFAIERFFASSICLCSSSNLYCLSLATFSISICLWCASNTFCSLSVSAASACASAFANFFSSISRSVLASSYSFANETSSAAARCLAVWDFFFVSSNADEAASFAASTDFIACCTCKLKSSLVFPSMSNSSSTLRPANREMSFAFCTFLLATS
mmetsp:Transcript_1987/g.6362  ORF Transcript_1987/g.6362 Transcript_1987/m.6362 type:complete len:206 (+) Transcript_1987:227-844(+)